jgi:uncharacterized protein YdhG (YjbR/CyaY superfamily)
MTTKNAEPERFTDEERAAIKERAAELRKTKRRGSKNGEQDVLAKIAELPDADRVLAERIHELVREHAPELTPKTWYGMPGYAKDGTVCCFFQGAGKFNTRYATLGFNDNAALDDGTMWPTAYALTTLTAANEKAVIELVRRAAG